MKKTRKIWIIVSVIVIAVVALWVWPSSKNTDEVTFSTAKVDLATIQNSITSTGTVEPESVTVGTQVSGIIDKIYVDYNSVVKKGQVIAELDRTNLTSSLNTAKAQLASATSTLNYETANYKRYHTLYNKGLVSADEYESALLNYRKAKEDVATSREQLQQAQTNLGYATITSPIDGVIIKRSVEEGQTVAASYSTPELFTIAKDLRKMRVIADVDEADIGDVKEGERVSFTVDAYPDDTFSGVVSQVRQNATTTNNVVTYEVVISAPNEDLKLKPGLTATVTIYTAEKKGVLSAPSKALRFLPTPEIVGKDKKIIDCKGKNKLWTYDGKTFRAYPVQTGMSDGINTEIISGMKKGTTIVTEVKPVEQSGDQADNGEERSPFAPGPKRNNKK